MSIPRNPIRCGRPMRRLVLNRQRRYDFGEPVICGRPAGHNPPCYSEEFVERIAAKRREAGGHD